MKVLIHVCCAPCAIPPIQILREEPGTEAVCYFSNFNIHPLAEFISRLEAFHKLAALWELDSIVDADYGLTKFLDATGTSRDVPARCARCYEVRLQGAARKARELECDAFTTTLLVSPYQPQDLIREAAQQAAREHGVAFLDRDFRPAYREIRPQAEELGLYMQRYCGCIYSEAERFRGKLEKLVERDRGTR
jgi:predicted adenine nucleotide alpha hydrolase (AANH) superfamily ATPase